MVGGRQKSMETLQPTGEGEAIGACALETAPPQVVASNCPQACVGVQEPAAAVLHAAA